MVDVQLRRQPPGDVRWRDTEQKLGENLEYDWVASERTPDRDDDGCECQLGASGRETNHVDDGDRRQLTGGPAGETLSTDDGNR